jgi:hypothetical protein
LRPRRGAPQVGHFRFVVRDRILLSVLRFELGEPLTQRRDELPRRLAVRDGFPEAFDLFGHRNSQFPFQDAASAALVEREAPGKGRSRGKDDYFAFSPISP